MNKKIILAVSIILLVGIALGTILISNSLNNKTTTSNEQENTNNNDSKQEESSNKGNTSLDENEISNNSNGIVIYFSATGTTEKVAKYISEITNSEMIEIIPKEEYTSNDLNYGNDNSRANREQNDSSARPEMKK